MGASGWHYFIPYTPDVRAALAALRDDVARRGDHLTDGINGNDGTHSVLDVWSISDEPIVEPPLNYEQLVALTPAQYRARLDARDARRGTLAPVADAVLTNVLGTTRPTRADVKRGAYALHGLFGTGSGIYLVVYQKDRPAEYYLAGASGD